MKPRERLLLMIVGGALALVVGQWLVKGYLARLATLDNSIRAAEERLAEEQAKQQELAQIRVNWRRTARQTLSTDVEDAKADLRDELFELAAASGLPDPSITLAPLKRVTDGRMLLTGSLEAEGSLQNIVAFLHQLHRQPYLLRCKTLDLAPVAPKAAGRGKTPQPVTADRLTMKARIETMIMPDTALEPRAHLKTAELDPARRHEVPRTMFASADRYTKGAGGIRKALFEPAKPPIPPPSKPMAQSPANNAIVDVAPKAPTLSLRWRSAHAKTHHVLFGEKGKLEDRGDVAAPTFRVPKVEIGKTYQWQVIVKNDSGEVKSDLFTFTTREGKQPTTPVRAPPPVYEKYVLDRVLSSPLTQQAVLIDPAKAALAKANPATAPDVRVEVGDKLYKGYLIYVHPRGVVTVTEDGKQQYFHPVGQPLNTGQLLTADSDPEVYFELTKLQEQAAGISERPG